MGYLMPKFDSFVNDKNHNYLYLVKSICVMAYQLLMGYLISKFDSFINDYNHNYIGLINLFNNI